MASCNTCKEEYWLDYTNAGEKFSAYISMLWPDMRLMYDFYDVMNSTNTINHLENLRKYVIKITWKRLILIWDNASFHLSMTYENISIHRKIG